MWISERRRVGCTIYHGDSGILAARDKIHELAERYRIARVSFDPWRAGEVVAELEERGIRTERVAQDDRTMIPASQALYRAIVDQQLTLPPDPELNQHAGSAIARHGRRGWRIDSPTSSRRINVDGVIALAIALRSLESAPTGLTLVGWV